MNNNRSQDPDVRHAGREEAALPTGSNPHDATSAAVAEAMQLPGVEGAGLGQDQAGNEVLIVYLRDAAAGQRIPAEIQGKRVQTEVTGPVRAQVSAQA